MNQKIIIEESMREAFQFSDSGAIVGGCLA